MFLTNLNCNVKWDKVCRAMTKDEVSFAYIQGKLICVKPSLQIFQFIFYSVGEILNCVTVVIDICIISKKIKFQIPSNIW